MSLRTSNSRHAWSGIRYPKMSPEYFSLAHSRTFHSSDDQLYSKLAVMTVVNPASIQATHLLYEPNFHVSSIQLLVYKNFSHLYLSNSLLKISIGFSHVFCF